MIKKFVFISICFSSLIGLYADDDCQRTSLCTSDVCDEVVVTDFVPVTVQNSDSQKDPISSQIEDLPVNKATAKIKYAQLKRQFMQRKTDSSGHLIRPPCRGKNIQVNDPSRQQIISPGPLGFPLYTFNQSETTLAINKTNRDNIVVVYNTDEVLFGTGFSTSFDGGKTWVSGGIPSSDPNGLSLGDPSIVCDRKGNFYVAQLDIVTGGAVVSVATSTDGGLTWTTKAIIAVSSTSSPDKPWLGIGPDPDHLNRDVLYVAWLDYKNTTNILLPNKLQLTLSKNGGKDWETKTVYTPKPNPNPFLPQDEVQGCYPTVDPKTGILYLPFIHYSNSLGRSEQEFPPSVVDWFQILKSEDAGKSFHFIKFNVPKTPGPTYFPVISPGVYVDVGLGFDMALVAGPKEPGVSGSKRPSYQQTARIPVQPAFDVRGDLLVLAFPDANNKKTAGKPSSKSDVFFIFSEDGGKTWSKKKRVNPKKGCNTQHVQARAVIGQDNNVHISYYTQHRNGTVDLHLTSLSLEDGSSKTQVITDLAFNIPPSVLKLADGKVVNYDTFSFPGYNLGEYQGLAFLKKKLYLCWSDARNLLTHTVNSIDPLSGQTQPQQDVFFQIKEAE